VISVIDRNSSLSEDEQEKIVDFLFEHLGKFGDPRSAIRKAIDFAREKDKGLGGLLIVSKEKEEITGVVVINFTGMQEYIPENILVYIATHKDHRGKGIGKELMEAAKESVKGDIALHVEADNPAVKLYEKVGFTKPYLEMRYKSSDR
jgi:GNAT superfamily N-acetyltransferase